jgi:hypothetical protein
LRASDNPIAIDSHDNVGSVHPSELWWCAKPIKKVREKGADMLLIGCDDHPAFQQIAFVDTAAGDCGERRLEHREEAEKFYRDLAAQGMKVRVGWKRAGMLAGSSDG